MWKFRPKLLIRPSNSDFFRLSNFGFPDKSAGGLPDAGDRAASPKQAESQ
jgi:hypothetical protein